MILPSKTKLNNEIMGYFNKDCKKPGEKHDDDDESHHHEFILINSISLASTSLLVIARKKLAPFINNISNDVASIGMMNMITNKSAVCISFNLGSIRMLFISCHLEAHDGNLDKRN
jgi:hypothetical protein